MKNEFVQIIIIMIIIIIIKQSYRGLKSGDIKGETEGTGWHKKNGNFWKPQQKLKKSKKKKLFTEIEPLQLAI